MYNIAYSIRVYSAGVLLIRVYLHSVGKQINQVAWVEAAGSDCRWMVAAARFPRFDPPQAPHASSESTCGENRSATKGALFLDCRVSKSNNVSPVADVADDNSDIPDESATRCTIPPSVDFSIRHKRHMAYSKGVTDSNFSKMARVCGGSLFRTSPMFSWLWRVWRLKRGKAAGMPPKVEY